MNRNQLIRDGRGFQYQFNLQIEKIILQVPFKCLAYITWKRGPKLQIQTKTKVQLQGQQSSIQINQKLSNLATCCLINSTKQFKPKKSIISLVIEINGSAKAGGFYQIDLCTILNPFDYKANGFKRVQQYLEKPAIAGSKIIFKLYSTFCKQMIADESSVGSGIGPNDFVIPFDKKMSQKKYQLSYKDNISVASYNNRGLINREGSSVKKDQFTTINHQNTYNFQQKLQTAKSNPLNQYDLKKTEHNQDIITDQGDGNINRQLINYQNKISKLESELNSQNLYRKQQAKRLNDYITENTKIKQQFRKIQTGINRNRDEQQQLLILKRQKQELISKNYSISLENNKLNQMNRNYGERLERTENQLSCIKQQKIYQQQKIDTLTKQLQNRNKNNTHSQQLQRQIKQLKVTERTLRQTLETYQGRLNYEERKHNEQKINIENILNQKLKICQKQLQKYKNQLKQFNNIKKKQIYLKQNQLIEKAKQIKQQYINIKQLEKSINYLNVANNQLEKDKITINNSNKQYKQELQKINLQCIRLKSQVLQQKDYKVNELNNKNYKIGQQNYKLLQKNTSLEQEIQNNKSILETINKSKQTLNNNLMYNKKEIENLQNQKYNLRDNNSRLGKQLKQKDELINSMKQQYHQLQVQKYQIEHKIKLEKQRTQKDTSIHHNDVDVDQILRQNLALEMELKYKEDQVTRLRQYEEKQASLQWKFNIQVQNAKELEEKFDILEKQMKDKSKALVLQIEKGKVLLEQRQQLFKDINQISQQLEQKNRIICTGEQQVLQMNNHIINIEQNNHNLQNQIRKFEKDIQNFRIQQQQKNNTKERIKQLEQRNAEKISVLQKTNRNLNIANEDIKALKQNIEEVRKQINRLQVVNKQSEEKKIQLQDIRYRLQSQNNRINSERKILEKKNQMMMQQLHSIKKQLQQSRGRSQTYARNCQDYQRVRNLENQLQKKQKLISKLNKQKLQLQEENVNMNVKMMKKLADIDRNGNTRSISIIGTTNTINK